ncbi:hypothetical protein ACQ4PT_062081 [Festuca glaucescens]
MGSKRFEKKKPGRLCTMSVNQARKTVQNFRAQGTYNNSNKRGGVAAAMQKKWRTPLEAPSCTRVVRWPNDVARSSSRLNNSKVSLQSDVKNARPSTSRPNNGLGSRQKYTKNPMPSSSRLNSGVVSSEKNMIFFSRSINASVSWEKNAKKPVPSSSSPNNGGTSLSKHIEMSRPSPSRPNNDMISSPKDFEKSLPSSSSPNGGSVPSPKNIERFMSAESRPSRLRGGFSSRKPTFIGSNGNSNSTFSISNKPPPSLVHGHSSNVEMGTQVRLQPQTTKACMGNMEQNAESMNVHVQLDSRKQNTALVSDGKANDGKYKSKMTEPLLEEKLGAHVDDDSAKEDSRPKKRMRDGTDQNLVGAESGTAVITETAVIKDCPTEVSHHFVSESFKLQYGIIKTQSKECVSLAAHLSTKYCDMVSKLSRSLPPMLEVTKLSRLEAWPKNFEASRPTDDNIALYFFPAKTRQDEDGADPNQLVKEVLENDMVLRAVVDEAELLIFPSVLLPEQYKTFQGEPYLWGVFRPRKEKFATVDEQHGIGHCAQEEMGKQHVADLGVRVQLDSRKQNTALVSDGKANDGKYKSKMTEPLLEEKLGAHVDDDSAKEDSRPKKRMRDGTDQNLVGAESGTAVITETAVIKDCPTEVSHHFVSESFKLQQYSSLHIDESVWSGIIKTQSKECVSLAAHLSTKYCDMVSKLSRSLPPMLEVTKLSRLEAWPKNFEASRPTDDNIALYFFPAKTRQDEDGADPNQLVKEVLENDMVLRAVVDEAELLIFPSVLLPEQYKTFQGEPYLWGVFRPRKEKFATVDEQHGIGHCAQEEMGKQHVADLGVGKKGYMVAGLNVWQRGKLGAHVDDDSAKEDSRPNKRMRDGTDQNLVGAESGTAVITETAVIKDCPTEVSHHFVSESFKLQQYSSLHIDESVWSGIIKTQSKEWVSLAAHLSTKYCDMVSKLSRSLPPMLEVTKLSRLEAWPKNFEASIPTDDNIALYFFLAKMRQDEDGADPNQLVKEVLENDMVLRAIVDEAELLIFPSVLLPEQYKTFQGEPYLWGLFRPRKEKFATVDEQHGIGHCAQEEMGKQHEQTPSVARPNTAIPVEDMVAGVRVQLDSRKQNTALVSDGKANDGKYKSKMTEPLLEEKLGAHVDDDSAKEDSRPKKRMRDGTDQNLVGAESGTAVITETDVIKDCPTEVSHHFVSESFKLQQCSSLHIDESVWSGIINTQSKECVSLAAHLSTKYCDMVSKLSRSLPPMLEVTKLSRLEAWPKNFEASRPTDDNIALYFFPAKTRQDEDGADPNQLVKEVLENDMVLRAIVDEAELLIFPSVLLPEQYKTFQGEPYLWGVFRPRKEKFATVDEQHGIGHCAQEEMGKQHVADLGVRVQLDSRKQNTALVSDGKANDGKYKSKMTEPLLEEKLGAHVDDDSAKEDSRPKKRMRDGTDQNLVGAESGTAVITETAVIKDCPTEVSHHFVSESFKLQQYSSLHIDESVWSGIIKTQSKEWVSLAAHLSTKYCDMVSKLSRSLPPMLEVTKLSRLEAWPKNFEASIPTDDNIALYFFLAKMRQDEDGADPNQLVKEVLENDMVLRAIVDEAELLIFPSVLLPEQYKTFQGEPYLWGLFRPRKEKFATVDEQHGIGHCAQEEMGKQHVADLGVGKKVYMVAGLNVWQRGKNTALVSDGKANDGKYKSKMTEPLLEEKLGAHVDDDSAKEDSRPKKRMRDGTDQNLVGAESGTAVITETDVIKDCPTEVSHHFVSESFKLQQCSSLHIDESVWSGIINTQSKECVSLAAHLSTKYCDMVSKLSRSLPPMLEVTKLSRLEAWPKNFEASRPTDDNIALYFFPAKTRQDEDGADPNQLVKEVLENDMVLRAIVDEAELLIFPSVLLPEQYKTFQGEPYLWGVFRPRKEKFATVDEQHGIGHCAQEEMGKQHVADLGVGKKGYMVAGLNVWQRGKNTALVSDGKANDGKYKSKMTEPLLEEKLGAHVDDDSAKEDSRPKKRMRDGTDQNLVGAESGTAVITETAVIKDCPTEVSHHFVSESFKLQQYSSLHIDESVWSGIIKTQSKECVSLAAHLSTKYCDMVSKLSRSLPPMLEVTKLSRLEAWPKNFEASRPTDDNIALYFFPAKTRQDEDGADPNQLVKEVLENDMVLRAIVDEAELLIFPSVLLPEQYKTRRLHDLKSSAVMFKLDITKVIDTVD